MTKQFAEDDAILNSASIITSRDKSYKDFNLLFQPRLGDADIYTVNDVKSVQQSVRTLILTNTYERPFSSNIGADIDRFLFSLDDSFTFIEIEDSIRRCLNNYEPRVRVNAVRIRRGEPQHINIIIDFTIISTQEEVTLEVAVERLR